MTENCSKIVAQDVFLKLPHLKYATITYQNEFTLSTLFKYSLIPATKITVAVPQATSYQFGTIISQVYT